VKPKRSTAATGKFLVGILIAILLLEGISTLTSAAEQAARPNVLFIAVDDLNTRIGSYGDPIAKTPNLDRLASRGVRFERAYTQFPLCNPSRVSVLLGRYPTTTETVDFSRPALLGRDWVTLPQFFRENDYDVQLLGKVFHHREPKPWSAGEQGVLQEQAIHRQMVEDLTRWEVYRSLAPARASTRAGLIKLANIYRPATPAEEREASTGPYSWGADVQHAKEAVDLLTGWASTGRPFFLGLGFFKPHVPLIVPRRFFDLYPSEKMPLPADFAPLPTAGDDVPPYALRPNLDLFVEQQVSQEEARRAIAAYYASISFMDEQLGRVLDALERLGLRENTIIVLWGDHGWHLGEKGMWAKGTLFDVSTRAPLIIVDPRKRTAGQASPRTVQFVDIYPTLVQLSGLSMPPGLEGVSLVPLLEDPHKGWDKPAFSAVAREDWLGRSVCTEQWCYMEWDEGYRGTELYDLQADPHQTRNLAKEPQYSEVITKLAKALHTSPIAGESPFRQARGRPKPQPR
jgi:uncharacterized sulfatase